MSEQAGRIEQGASRWAATPGPPCQLLSRPGRGRSVYGSYAIQWGSADHKARVASRATEKSQSPTVTYLPTVTSVEVKGVEGDSLMASPRRPEQRTFPTQSGFATGRESTLEA